MICHKRYNPLLKKKTNPNKIKKSPKSVNLGTPQPACGCKGERERGHLLCNACEVEHEFTHLKGTKRYEHGTENDQNGLK